LPDGGGGLSMGRPIVDVAIVGGGLAGWSAAAAIKRRLPQLNVAIVDSGPPADSLCDRLISTLPSIAGFHDDIGLTEADTLVRAGSGLRAGIAFEGWVEGRPAYVHAYGDYGRQVGPVSFHQLWLRTGDRTGRTPFDHYSIFAELARRERLLVTESTPGAGGYGLQLNLDRYRQLLRGYALHVGVTERKASAVDVRLRSNDGFVESLRLSDGGFLTADLFIDCTGALASVRSRLDDRFEDWRHWLVCDRILFGRSAPVAELPLIDRSVALPFGWRWQSASPSRTSHGIVYSSADCDEQEAARSLNEAGASIDAPAIAFRTGRRPQPWLRNCVAVGEAAVVVEPLEWTNLHLAHSAIDRIVSMMPDRECAPIELAEYNRQCLAEADRVRDFLCLHYVTSRRRGEPFWDRASRIELPPSLAHTLSMFEERGRLPFHEEETFSRDSWLAVLLGNGIVPRRIDPLADSISDAEAEQVMTGLRDSIAAVARSQPTHSAYLQQLSRQLSR
jgi:tryptophan halogenase